MDYDLAVIGAGWAGFNAATRAAELGLRTVLIEKDKLGGTCLNYGCIPTKSLIQSAKVYSLSKKALKFGIEIQSPKVNLGQIQERKQLVVNQLQGGMQFILKDKNVQFIAGEAKLISNEEISVDEQKIKTKNILIATGSRPAQLPFLKFDGKKILSSNDILNMPALPASMLIIGAGVIGCEFASLFNILGSRVTIVELMPQVLPLEDAEIAKRLEVIFKKAGITVNTGVDVKTVNLDNYECVLLSIGRTPSVEGLDLEKVGVHLDKTKVVVDDYLRTNIPNIYAAGDCTAKIMLAHYASYQGQIVAENIANPAQPNKVDNTIVPNCIFTHPQIARAGLTEKEARECGLDTVIKKMDFRSCGMAHVLDETEGFIKIICDKKSDEILGASIIGPQAPELIAGLTIAIQSRLKVSKIKSTIFAHPTLSEIIHEAL